MFRRLGKLIVDATRRYFVAGLVALAPLVITLAAIAWIIRTLDNLLLPSVIDWFVPGLEAPPQAPPLVGAIFTFAVILLAGVIVRHFFGQEFVRIWERALVNVPIARSIYAGVKQLFEAILTTTSSQSNFNRVVLVEYPRRGMYGLAFVTGRVRGSIADAFDDGPMLNCFIPTTPNPTSGFYLVVPEADVIEIDLSIEDAFKVIMSAGLVTPRSTPPTAVTEPASDETPQI
jgi:uncharacterized membrane protein